MKSYFRCQSKSSMLLLEKVLLISLTLPSFLSFYYTLSDYMEKKTVVSISERPLTSADIPTATVCFMDQRKLEYGKDVSIYVLTSRSGMPDENTGIKPLNNGENYYHYMGDRQTILTELVVKQSPTLSTKSCFKLSLKLLSELHINGATHMIGMFFIDLAENITKGTLIVTSEKNSYGAITGHWYDGDVKPFKLISGNHQFLKIPKIRRFEYKYSESYCSEKSFYECWSSKLHFCKACQENATVCSPYSLPSNELLKDLPMCNQEIAQNCLEECYPKWALCNDQMPCSQQVYSLYEGKAYNTQEFANKYFSHLSTQKNDSNAQRIAKKQSEIFHFTLLLKNHDWKTGKWTKTLNVEVHTESYVWTSFTLLGNIGGSMGLWAGFSCPGLIAWLSQKSLRIQKLVEDKK